MLKSQQYIIRSQVHYQPWFSTKAHNTDQLLIMP